MNKETLREAAIRARLEFDESVKKDKDSIFSSPYFLIGRLMAICGDYSIPPK